jgi:hypothetical protein
MNTTGKNRFTTPEETASLIRLLARQLPDSQIARLLNRAGKPTGRGDGWTERRVCSFRNDHEIAVYRDGEWAGRGEITQLRKGAPWVIKAEDVAAFDACKESKRPLIRNAAQRTFDFQ